MPVLIEARQTWFKVTCLSTVNKRHNLNIQYEIDNTVPLQANSTFVACQYMYVLLWLCWKNDKACHKSVGQWCEHLYFWMDRCEIPFYKWKRLLSWHKPQMQPAFCPHLCMQTCEQWSGHRAQLYSFLTRVAQCSHTTTIIGRIMNQHIYRAKNVIFLEYVKSSSTWFRSLGPVPSTVISIMKAVVPIFV